MADECGDESRPGESRRGAELVAQRSRSKNVAKQDTPHRRGYNRGETPEVEGAVDVLIGGVGTGGFTLGAAGSSSIGAVSGVSTFT